jgi:hypothetical protein
VDSQSGGSPSSTKSGKLTSKLSGKVLTASKLRLESSESEQSDSGLQQVSFNHPKSHSYRGSIQAASWRQCQASVSMQALHPLNWMNPPAQRHVQRRRGSAAMVCKGLAYGVSLSSFRGGPVFPAIFADAAYGIAMSHLAGLPLVAGVAMGRARCAW